MIRSQGYEAEEHSFENSDGYSLTLHRVPHGKQDNCRNEFITSSDCRKPVVFLQHGLVSSSADFIISGPERGLAFILADAGYDVWMGNFRGNTYSRKHRWMSPESKEFWNFSWHELGVGDLPEMIDFVLQKTKETSLHYIGHSQGTTTFLVMTSTRPHYNSKIKSAHLMAPVAFMENARSPVIRFLAPFSNIIEGLSRWLGHGEFMPSGDFMNAAGQRMCREKALQKSVCANAFFLLAGYDSRELNTTLIPDIMQRYPAGSAIRQMVHYLQEKQSGRFCEYDYGFVENMIKYGTAVPPSYKLTEVRAPVSLYYSHNDLLASVDDVERLRGKLPNVKENYLVANPQWNHIDFLWGTSAKTVVYDRIIANMRRGDGGDQDQGEEEEEDRS